MPTETLPERPASTGIPGSGDDELWQAVAALPFTQRAAVVYHHVAGLPYAEIAEILGNSTDAARRNAADGIAALRRTYAKGSAR